MPKKIPKKYNIVALHTGGKDFCNGVAFYYQGPIIYWDEVVESRKSIFPSGKIPEPISLIKCGTCGIPLKKGQLLDELTLWVSEEEYHAKA